MDGRSSRVSLARSGKTPRERSLGSTNHPSIFSRGERYVLIWRHQGRQYKRTFPTLDQALAASGFGPIGVPPWVWWEADR